MIIYFADRQFNITGNASTNLPGGLRIISDTLTEDVESGVNSLSITIAHDETDRKLLESAVQVGRFVLKNAGRGEETTGYNSLFQIIETEYNANSHEMTIYAEDAGLDLINRSVDAVSYKNLTLEAMMKKFIPGGWTLNIEGVKPANVKSNEWDGESTLTERLLSVAGLWDYEIYYTFVVEGLKITQRIINVTAARGNQTATAQLRLNKDVNNITTKTSISELATAYRVTGGTPEGKDAPINLKNYTYSYTDKTTGDVYTVDKSTGQMRNTSAMKRWASILDTDGLIVKAFEFDTTNKATLAGQARAELQKVSKESTEYEVEFVTLPDDIQIGDRINIIDEQGELYLEARLLHIESSIVNKSISAIIGEYVLKSSGISSEVRAIARTISENLANQVIMIGIVAAKHTDDNKATLSATVFKNGISITDMNAFNEAFTSGQYLQWYKGDSEISGANDFTYIADLTDGTNYSCKILIEEEDND